MRASSGPSVSRHIIVPLADAVQVIQEEIRKGIAEVRWEPDLKGRWKVHLKSRIERTYWRKLSQMLQKGAYRYATCR